MRIEDFDEFKLMRDRMLEAHRLHAKQLAEMMNVADSVYDPTERLGLIAPFYRKTAELQRDRMALDRCLSMQGNITDKYIKQLKSYIGMAVEEKIKQGTLKPSDARNKEAELLKDLIAPANFCSLEFVKNQDQKLDLQKHELKERQAWAEEYVLGSMEEGTYNSIKFKRALATISELTRYRCLEDPAECISGSAVVFNRFWSMLAETLGMALSRQVSLADVLKVDEVEAYLKKLRIVLINIA